MKPDLVAAGYKGEKIVILAASTIPDHLGRGAGGYRPAEEIGMNTDFQALEWGTVVQRRASRDRSTRAVGISSIRSLAGSGTFRRRPISPSTAMEQGHWFGWPTDPKMEALCDSWFEAPDLAAQKQISEEMQVEFWQSPPYAPMGMYFNRPLSIITYRRSGRLAAILRTEEELVSLAQHVAVIGAGIVGAATAVELLRDGHRVTIIEPGDPGGPQAASYGNGTLAESRVRSFPCPQPGSGERCRAIWPIRLVHWRSAGPICLVCCPGCGASSVQERRKNRRGHRARLAAVVVRSPERHRGWRKKPVSAN